MHADADYIGARKRASGKRLAWHIGAKHGVIKAMKPGRYKRALEHLERVKPQVRA